MLVVSAPPPEDLIQLQNLVPGRLVGRISAGECPDLGLELAYILLAGSNEDHGLSVGSLKALDVEAEECETVINMSDSSLALAEFQFEFPFKKPPGFFFQLHRTIFAAIPEQEPIVRISD